MSDVGFAALARPHGGDTAAYAEAAHERWGWVRSEQSPEPAWLDAAIRLVPCRGGVPADTVPLLDPAHEVLWRADSILAAWPAMRAQCVALLDTIMSGIAGIADSVMMATGGSCGPGDGWGEILVVANNPVGYAEGVVHELGHHKLRALRIDMEHHDRRILLNEDHEEYASGVRKDRPRPMSAVLHAHYSYLHVTELELRAVRLGYDISQMVPYQLRRLQEGRATIVEHARWTAAGEGFRDAVIAWTDELLDALQKQGGGD